MKTKLEQNFETYIQMYKDGRCSAKDMKDYYEEATDAIYKAWKAELISDNLFKELNQIAYDYSFTFIRLWHTALL